MRIIFLIFISLCQVYLIPAQLKPGTYKGKTKGGPVSLKINTDKTFQYQAQRGALHLEHQGSWFITGDTLATFFPNNCDQPGATEKTSENKGIHIRVYDVDDIRKYTFAKNVEATIYSGGKSEKRISTSSNDTLRFNLSIPIDSIVFHSRFCRERINYKPNNPESNSFDVVLKCYRFEFMLNHTFNSYQLWRIKKNKLLNLKNKEKLIFTVD